ncbi:Inner membrane protein YqiK [compost metagenome]
MTQLITYGAIIIAAIVALLVLGLIIARLYTKSDAERAFVRTGMGNRKVVTNGGALVLPVVHSLTWVNLKTLRLNVSKKEDHSLVTGDKLRIDVEVDFFVRVSNNADAVTLAAQTLGNLTMDPRALASQVEAKFVDALRAVAARMTLAELHQQRHEFVQQVQQAVEHDLAKNGLEMESVSLTALNQTDKRYFNVDNVLDAEGLTQLTQVTEASKKRINDIEQTNQVAIEERNREAAKQRAEIRRQTVAVAAESEVQIAKTTADAEAEKAATAADGRRRAEEARISTDQQVRMREVEANKTVKEAETQAETTLRLAKQAQAITVAEKSKDEARATAEANEARAKAVAAEEAVVTARETEVANRDKAVAVIAAHKRAQEESIGIVVAAEAEKDAATNRAEARRIDAAGERDALVAKAEGVRAEGEAHADALAKRNAAQNTLSEEMVAQQVKLALIENLPAIIAKAVAPMERIESIRIAAVDGLNGAGKGGAAGSGAGAGAGAGNGGLVDQVFSGALGYQFQKPVMDNLLREVGLGEGASLNNLVGSSLAVAGMGAAAPAAAQAAPVAAANDAGPGAEQA